MWTLVVIFYSYICSAYIAHCCHTKTQVFHFHIMHMWWRHRMETFSACEEFTGHWGFPWQRPVIQSVDVSLICAWINSWLNNRKAGDLRHHCAHYDAIVLTVQNNVYKSHIYRKTSYVKAYESEYNVYDPNFAGYRYVQPCAMLIRY